MNFQDLVNQPDKNMQVFATVRSVGNIEYTQAKGTAKQRCSLCDDAGDTQYATIYPGTNPELQQSHINQRLEFNLSARAGQGKGAGKMYYGGFWECPNPQENQQAPQGQQGPPQNQQAPPQQQNTQNVPQSPCAWPDTKSTQAPPPQGSTPVCSQCSAKLGWPQNGPLACPKCDAAKFSTQTPPPQQQQPQGEPRRNMEYAYEVTPGVMAKKQRGVALEAASRVMIGKSDCAPQDVLDMAIAFYEWIKAGEKPMSPAQQPGTDQGEDDIPF